MKRTLITVCVSAGVAGLILGGGVNQCLAVSAAAIPNADVNISSPFQNMRWEQEKKDKLLHAYSLLEQTKRDYDGHRGEAMRSLHKAADILGIELTSWHHRPEDDQLESDAKMAAAQKLLLDLQDKTGGKEQERITHAINELNKALKAR